MLKFEEFKQSDWCDKYKFNKEEILKIKVDLTFVNIDHHTTGMMGPVEYSKHILSLHPHIKPILQILKRYLQIKKLNTSFNGNLNLIHLGGLSSFCLFLLIAGYIKGQKLSLYTNNFQNNSMNLGRLLLDLLEFYGKMFNFHNYAIDMNVVK